MQGQPPIQRPAHAERLDELRFTDIELAPDGPGVFVAQASVLDEHGIYRGAWVDPTQTGPTLEQAVRRAVGDQAFASGDWVIVDQVDSGLPMVPEQVSVAGLRRLVLHQRHGGR